MKMPNSRNSLAIFLLFALLIPILAACGGGQPAASPEEEAPAVEEEAPAEEGATEEGEEAPTEGEEPAEEATTEGEEEAEEPAEEGAAEGSGDNILRIHQAQYPDVFDPQKSSFSNEIVILAMNYEGLTKLNENLEAVPAAAESWEFNEDATEITFKIREGLTYSDGSPITAENFRYAMERNCDPNTAGEYQSILFDVAGCEAFATTLVTDTAGLEETRAALDVEAVDDQTLRVGLAAPAPYFPYIAGLWVTFPAKQDLIEAGGETWWQDVANHVGNGPFQITRIEEDQLIEFKANENYWGGAPQIAGLEYIYQGDSSVALEAYRSGQIDIMSPDPSQLPSIESDAELSEELLVYPGASTFNLSFNLTLEPFSDQKVREAFSYAFDRETYCEVIRNGDCTPTLSWIPEGVPGAIETDQFGYDPDAALQALSESTYGGPEGLPEIKLTYNSDDPATQPRVEWIAGQFREVFGIEVTLDPVEGKTLVALRKDPTTFPQMLAFGGWIQDYPDPQNWLSVFWTCDSTFAQRVAYCNEEFDALIEQADTSTDQEERIQLYEQAGEILIADVPGPFAYNLSNIFLVDPRVQNYVGTAADSPSGWPGQWASPLTITVEE
ncbi:MAG: peptide ABC transporter substrate-binding protein [Chloroflexi bacterium AL-W]|nr:peptide ABC transporter substrate-binding protein [Chloroflexi bacterium AL-N1]NOK68993.1 peptide ABC transporter substrate-binding protein [Chloroflexi bacterium AL-N10]NOK76976.1 peptide ABC transporter substrate-binding protein [Chloroflexi bacterium AL-N5]NOK82636.1 peptide ABC transporter substrate-binding protein [Chloroflexi bacterium AL-W]NOK90833.1 peptide ABC transporter substrate-binding protein [Chloroflexi bacterium AL-N15]